MSLRLRLLLLVLLILLPAAALLLYTAADQRRAASRRARDGAARLAVFASNAQREHIEATRQLLTALAAVPSIRDADGRACQPLVGRLLELYPRYANIGAATRDGEVFCSAVPQLRSVNVIERSFFWRAVVLRDFAMGDFMIGRISGKPSVVFGFPALAEAGQVRGVAFAALDLDWLGQLMAQARLPEHSTVAILDRNGLVLASHPRAEADIGKPIGLPLLPAILGTQGLRSIEAPGPDGSPYLFAFTALQQREGVAAYVSVGMSKTVAFAEADGLLRRNLLVLGIVAAVTLLIGWVAADLFILRRVRALVSATRRLSAGDFHTRSGLAHGGGELGQLAQAFDQMAESLQQAEERRALEEELRRKNYELEQQNLAIQEANRLKSEFVSMVSHELRTPLTSIGGYTELLLERDASALSPDARQSLVIVKTNAERLLKLINDLLDLSRMEAGKIELRRAAVDLRPLIVGVGESLRPLIDARRQRLRLDLEADLPTAWADADRVEQIITNLVANAHKYTPAEGSIAVGAWRDGGSVRLDVSDTGPGLSAVEREQLFTRFFRAPGTRRVAGSGLGLVITRLLVELHGGRIDVSSAPGEGSVFSVWLPVSDPLGSDPG